jgi:hypothetical protein
MVSSILGALTHKAEQHTSVDDGLHTWVGGEVWYKVNSVPILRNSLGARGKLAPLWVPSPF